jgi:cytochrome c oxidase subunit 3
MAAAAPSKDRYYVPDPSVWPFMLTVGLVLVVIGVSNFLESKSFGTVPLLAGVALSIYMIFRWFAGVIHESESGLYGAQVDRTYRWSMAWFIFSEVMFFAAFFGALYYARELSLPWLAGAGDKIETNAQLWAGFEAIWPSNGPAEMGGAFETIPAIGIPLLNTILLMSSGVTLTLAHHALKEGHRTSCILWMWATIGLGVIFLGFQGYEYVHAYRDLNLTLASGIYGSTFFMLTGFHGAHVILGTLMLLVITLRLMRGHFKPESHFGFEAAAWYWHFVDVVWIGLFVVVYWL